MSMTVSIRVASLTAATATGQAQHDLRTAKAIPNYIDQKRINDNSIIVEPKTMPELRSACEERRNLRDTQRKMKSNATVAVAGIITFGTKAQSVIRDLSYEKQNALYRETAERIAAKLNTDVISLVAHRDEYAPHAHFQLLGYDREGLPVPRKIKKQVARELQDIAGEVYAEFGINRGVSKELRIENGEDPSSYIHMSLTELHGTIEPNIEKARETLQAAEAMLKIEQKKLPEIQFEDVEVKTGMFKTETRKMVDNKKLWEYTTAVNNNMLSLTTRLQQTEHSRRVQEVRAIDLQHKLDLANKRIKAYEGDKVVGPIIKQRVAELNKLKSPAPEPKFAGSERQSNAKAHHVPLPY